MLGVARSFWFWSDSTPSSCCWLWVLVPIWVSLFMWVLAENQIWTWQCIKHGMSGHSCSFKALGLAIFTKLEQCTMIGAAETRCWHWFSLLLSFSYFPFPFLWLLSLTSGFYKHSWTYLQPVQLVINYPFENCRVWLQSGQWCGGEHWLSGSTETPGVLDCCCVCWINYMPCLQALPISDQLWLSRWSKLWHYSVLRAEACYKAMSQPSCCWL